MNNCIFCKIASGEIPSYKVLEDEKNLAFLDIRPMKKGHTLVIPKKHYSYLFEIDDQDYIHLMKFSKKVADVLKKAFGPKSGKVGVIVYGLDVEHLHLHLSPIDRSGDLSLANAKPASGDELKAVLRRIDTVR